jgi:hypothetical protein
MRLRRLVSVGVLPLVLFTDIQVSAQYSCPDQRRFWDPDKCTAFLEQRVLEKFPGLFSRDGQRLVVRFANGQQKVFVSGERRKGSESSSIGYIFLDYFPKIQYGLVRVAYYEGWTDLLLNMRTGESTDIHDDPVFSPDGLRFAVAKDDQMVGRGIFAVYNVNATGVAREFLEEMDKRGVKNLKWLADDAISFVAYGYDPPIERSRVLKREREGNKSTMWRIR